jgi:hypothetical protein
LTLSTKQQFGVKFTLIHKRHPLCRHITNWQIKVLITSKLVTPEQVRVVGLQA